MTSPIRIHHLADIVTVLPYRLGYHPDRSLVLLALDGRRLGMTARADLTTDARAAEATVRAMLAPLQRVPALRVLLVVYEDVEGESDAVLAAALDGLEPGGSQVLDVVVVRDGCWSVPTCAEGCCPARPTPLPDPADVPAVAELVARGVSPLADRRALDRVVEPVDPDLHPWRGRPGRPRRRTRRPSGARAWAEVLGTDPPGPGEPRSPSRPVALRAVDILADVRFRDALVGWLAPGVLPREAVDATVLALLEETLPRWGGMGSWTPRAGSPEARRALLETVLALARRVPESDGEGAAAVCSLAAQLAWAAGDGALARSAVLRARAADPGYRLALLVERLLDAGVPPPGTREEGEDRLAAG
ncbi:DUF4192 domain-containing protein [Phycicoccus sp. BSK3Z-2]|uniref:DUF4192 domain-containing protein n=1 Tax=Phycicoccus avicenniae TaxID=2828860 RepID=A0A941DDM6_9MICO|nr:DUF4192 domain-containing protein [Phycicoccus avicenniae]MBR7744402.1 DUF4192 domain-containing protein [Phycicoccus avicenniae]